MSKNKYTFKKLTLFELLFYMGSFSFVFWQIFSCSLISQEIPAFNIVLKLLRCIFLLVTIIKLLSVRKYTVKEFIYIVVILMLCGAVYLISRDQKIISFAQLIILSLKMDKNTIIKGTLIPLVISTSIVVSLAFLKFIPDKQFEHIISVENDYVISHSLGFDYYSYLPMYSLFSIILWFNIKNKNSNIDYIIALIIILGVDFFCHKRVVLYLGLLYLIIHYMLLKFKNFKINNKLFKLFSSVLPFIMFSLTIFVTLKFADTNSAIDKLLNGRLHFGKMGFMLYPVTLFGNQIQMIGSSVSDGTNYFYIDSGYIYSLLGYGILITIILLALLSIIINYSCKNNDKNLYIWSIMVLIYNIFGDTLLTTWYNPLFLIYIILIGKKYSMSKEEIYEK